MKNTKHRWMSKTLSLVAAITLSAQSLVMMAWAAPPTKTDIVDGQANAATKTGATDIFYYDITAVSVATGTTITGFEFDKDILVVKLPAGFTIFKTATATETKVSARDGANADVLVATITNTTKDASARVINPSDPILWGVTASAATVEIDGSVTLTADVTLYDGTAVAAPSITWTNGSSVTTTTTKTTTLKLSTLGTPTLKATVGGITEPVSVTVTACPKQAVVGSVVGPAGNAVVVGKAGGFADFSVTTDYQGVCAVSPAHTPLGAVTWSITDSPAPAGFSINTIGKLTIPAVTVPTTVHVSATGGGVTKAAPTLTVTRNTTCGATVSGVSLTTSPTDDKLDIATGTGSANYTATVSFNNENNCNDPAHGAGSLHNNRIVWTVKTHGTANNPAGITIADTGSATTTVSATQSALPYTEVDVVATVGGFTTVPKLLKVSRTAICTKQLVPFGGVAGIGAAGVLPSVVQPPVNAVVYFDARSSLATLQLSGINITVAGGGTCEYENTPGSPHLTTTNHHALTWAIVGATPASVVSFDTKTGTLVVDRSKITPNQTVSVKATYLDASNNTITLPTSSFTLRQGTIPTTGGDGGTTESDRNSEQWDSVEYKLDDADSKDTIRASLGSNTNMPSRIIDTIRGRNVTAEFSVDGGFTWYINGRDLKTIPGYQIYIPLGVKSISNSDASRMAKDHDIEIFSLSHEGSFYGTYYLEQRIDTDYAKKTVYLYKYVKDASRLTYKGAAKVDEDGFVKLPFTSASTYVITDRALYGESANTVPGGGTGNTGGGTTGGGTTGGGGTVTPPPAVTSSSSSSSSSTTSSESSSISEIPSSSTPEISKPTEAEPDEPKEPAKKKSFPIIIPILLVVVTITVVAVVLLAKGGGMHIGE